MADVEMTDAGAAPKVNKNAKAGASGDVAEGKKKFEVKKVWIALDISETLDGLGC